MSVATELTRIQGAKADIKTAIEAKGVQVPSNALIDTYDTYIGQISGGATKDYIVEGTEYDPQATYTGYFNPLTQIVSANIPSGFTTISSNAFQNCTNLTSVTIPSSVTSIGGSAFNGCISLTSVIIGSGVTSINAYAFQNCSSLTTVTLPNSLTTIGTDVFQGSGLTSINIPSGVTSIGYSVFGSCDSLVSITVDNNNSKYDSRNNCNAIIETSTNTLFTGCQNTVIPNTVTKIGDFAFSYCSSLTSITIPSSVTSIGKNAFFYCTNLTSVTIPSSVTSIGNNAFQYCNSLSSVTVERTTPPTLGTAAVFNNNASGRKIYVPAASVNTYKAARGWSTYAADIEAIPSE